MKTEAKNTMKRVAKFQKCDIIEKYHFGMVYLYKLI